MKTIVFVHGAWMTPLSWERFVEFFGARGYRCIAPPWPGKEAEIETQRSAPSPRLAGLGVAEIVAHYEHVIRGLDEPPALIGHSFGGLFVQMLLDRGLGRAGVAIDSAPPAALPVYQWSALRSNLGVLTTPFGWRSIVRISLSEFRYAFVHTLAPAEQRAAYERYVVPETGRIFFQAALAMANPWGATRVTFRNPARAPLLLIAGERDHIIPPSLNLATYRRYRFSPAATSFREFPGRTHAIILQDGWDEVARFAAEWIEGSLGVREAVAS